MRAPAVQLNGVCFSHGGVGVLDGADLTVDAGEAVVLTGENGAGKSTLLKLVLGEESPIAGQVRLFGEDPVRFHHWARVGYVPQRSVAFGRFPATVKEVVSANLYASRGPLLHPLRRHVSDGPDPVWTCLERVGMRPYARRLVGELSGGQMQRVLLARALVNNPDLLVLDEPTSGLDERAAKGFVETVGALRSTGVSLLLVTHDLERLSGLYASVYRLSQGRVSHV